MIQKYKELKKQGYYFRPNEFKNCTVVQLTKNCGDGMRTTFAEFNPITAQKLSNMFGFSISEPIKYFGSGEPVKVGFKRIYYAN